jgi:superfamily II DNA or RNA helicase
MFKWKEGVFYPKNKDKFLELFGSYISYYDPQKRLESSNKKSFPTVYYKNVYVPINPEREMAFIDIVNEENERMKKPNEELKFRDYEKYKKQKQNYFIATSRLKSSQYSNFYYPVLDSKKYKPGTEKAEKEEEEQKETSDLPVSIEDGGDDNLPRNAFPTGTPMNIGVPDKLKEEGGWITKQLLEDLYDQGEKIKQIVDDIETHEGKHAVYTRFKTYFGSRLLGAILDLKEIPYVYFDGDMDDKDRVRILEQFNSPENINGDKIKVIILTSAGSAGINLKEIRRFHILEQYFNLSYLKQVVGRGNRYLSHQRLPENKRNLTVLNYFLQLSDDELTNNYSSDVLSFKKGKDKDNSISNVRELLQNLDI